MKRACRPLKHTFEPYSLDYWTNGSYWAKCVGCGRLVNGKQLDIEKTPGGSEKGL